MSIFKNFVDNVCFSLDKKRMKVLKTQQIKINDLNKQIIDLIAELQEQTKQIETLNNKLIESLEQHNFHQQNLHAKQSGFKSAHIYKMKIKADIANNKKEQLRLTQQQEHYQDDLKKNQEYLIKTNNTIWFYNNLQATTLISYAIAVIITLGFLLLAISPKILFEKVINFSIYGTCLGVLVLSLILAKFFFDKSLYKKQIIRKVFFFDYLFSAFLVANILLASVPKFGAVRDSLLFVFYLFLVASVINILVKNEKMFKDNENYSFPIDFTIFNLAFVSFSAMSVINSLLINNEIMSILIKAIYSICVLLYLILFIWEAKSNSHMNRGFKQYISLTISIVLLLAFIICSILNFVLNFSQALEVLATFSAIITLIAPLYQNFKKQKNNIS